MRRLTRFQGIVGTALTGMGIFFLYSEMADAAAHIRQATAGCGSQNFGMLCAAIISVSASAAAHSGLLRHVMLQVFQSSWPLSLVLAGTGLSRIRSLSGAAPSEKKDSARVEMGAGRSTWK